MLRAHGSNPETRKTRKDERCVGAGVSSLDRVLGVLGIIVIVLGNFGGYRYYSDCIRELWGFLGF